MTPGIFYALCLLAGVLGTGMAAIVCGVIIDRRAEQKARAHVRRRTRWENIDETGRD